MDRDYPLPYRTSTVESLFSLATRSVANQIGEDIRWADLPPHLKTMLVVILGERDKLTGPVLRVLAHPGLTSIRLSGEHARNSILYILKCLTKLTCLEIPAHEISAEGLIQLFPCLPFLKKVDLSSSDQVTDDVLRAMGNSCPMLHTINLTRCPSFTHTGIQHLAANLYSLTALDVSHTKMTDDAIRALAEGPSKRSITELRIDGCRLLTPRCGEYLEAFSRIGTLSFYDCPSILQSEWFLSFGSRGTNKLCMKNLTFTVD